MKVLNKNYKLVKVGKEFVVIPITKAPKYYIGEMELSEYDVRNLQAEVALGNLHYEVANKLNIKDENNQVFNFREDGVLTNTPKGYDTLSKMVLSIIRAKREKENEI